MRFAKVMLTVGLGIFAAGAAGLTGTWALAASTVVMGFGGLVLVIAMEERDLGGIEGLYPTAVDAPRDVMAEPAIEATFAEAA
jgi:hypothetical protein